jgi:type 1 glutamine amidotransferase
MKGPMYQRPPFPATWARKHGKGRVFFTSLGHREDVWESKEFQSILIGGILWALGRAEADISPNLRIVAPQAEPAKT